MNLLNESLHLTRSSMNRCMLESIHQYVKHTSLDGPLLSISVNDILPVENARLFSNHLSHKGAGKLKFVYETSLILNRVLYQAEGINSI